jgi:hypothetical protein
MFRFQKLVSSVIALSLTFAMSFSAQANESQHKNLAKVLNTSAQTLNIYKNPSCGCCKKWIEHVSGAGFPTEVHNRANLTSLKEEKGIQPRYRSCHTAISKEGYVFEGHVPAKFIQQFLSEKPKDALGLAAPGMGMGSPGMEMGNKFMPYQVLLLKKDGSSEVYSSINSYKEQF